LFHPIPAVLHHAYFLPLVSLSTIRYGTILSIYCSTYLVIFTCSFFGGRIQADRSIKHHFLVFILIQSSDYVIAGLYAQAIVFGFADHVIDHMIANGSLFFSHLHKGT
jgi:hypothetical protein